MTNRKIVLSLTAVLSLSAIAYLCSSSDNDFQSEFGHTTDVMSVEYDAPVRATQTSETRQAIATRTIATQPIDGFFRAPVGSTFRYKVLAKATTHIGTADAPRASGMQFGLDGTLVVTIVARRDGEMVQQWTVDANTLRVAQIPSSGDTTELGDVIRQDLARPTLLRVGNDGKILGYVFDKNMHQTNHAWIRTLASDLRFVVDGKAQTEGRDRWESTDADNTGTADYTYRWQTAPAERRKLSRDFGGYQNYGKTEQKGEGQGRARAALDTIEGFLIAADTRQEMRIALSEMDAVVTHAQSTQAKLESKGTVALEDLPAIDWNEMQWAPESGADVQSNHAEEATEARFAAMLEGKTAQSLIAEARALLQAQPVDDQALFMVREQLAWMIRIDPKTLEQLDPMVRRMAQEPQIVGMALSAIGATQLEPAQKMLGSYFGESRLDEATRMSAAFSMFQLEDPIEDVVATVQKLHRDNQSSTELDSSLDSATLMLLGQVAGKPNGKAAMAQLLAAAPRADAKVTEVESWLMALGNSASEETFGSVVGYLGHGSVDVRKAAVSALGTIKTDAATEVLRKVAQGDPSQGVRKFASELVRGR